MRGMVILLCCITFAAAGCDREVEAVHVCAGFPNYNVIVQVRDSVTGVPIADGATGTLQVDGLTLQLHPGADGLSLLEPGFDKHPGEYTVSVQKTGYVSRVLTGIVVKEDHACGTVETQIVGVKLMHE